eukprot:scaffold5866_cov93-Isochrysis_galbana.AAC.8
MAADAGTTGGAASGGAAVHPAAGWTARGSDRPKLSWVVESRKEVLDHVAPHRNLARDVVAGREGVGGGMAGRPGGAAPAARIRRADGRRLRRLGAEVQVDSLGEAGRDEERGEELERGVGEREGHLGNLGRERVREREVERQARSVLHHERPVGVGLTVVDRA